jgi:hypothetical protein
MAQYTKILADEFNTIRNTVVGVLGTGSGTRGYGSPTTSYTVAANATINHAEFDALKSDINVCYNHIAGTNATLNSVVADGSMTWANILTYQTAATYIDTNRDTNGGAKTASSPSTKLPAGWGNASGNRIATMTGTVNFASAEAMRFYFNQGSTLAITGSGAATGGSSKSNAFGTLANALSLSLTQSNYRGGTGASQTQTTTVSPYSTGTADNIAVSFGVPGSTSVSFSIVCSDKGGDDGDNNSVVVASNIDIDLTFYVSASNVSNTSGITTYTPTVSYGSWSYAA